MSGFRRWVGAALLVSASGGCALIAQGASSAVGAAERSQAEEAPPEPVAVKSPPSSPAPRAASSPAPPACPSDLALDWGARDLETRKHPGYHDLVRYRAMTWAPGHRRPVGDDFPLAPAVALDAIVAAEAAHPEIVPAGFRARVAERPRDAALRLEMARCELGREETLRRASYDAMVAVLLGDPDGSEVLAKAVQALHAGTETKRFCGPRACAKSDKWCKPCPSPKECDTWAGYCLAPPVSDRYRIGATQLEIEHTLSRAALGLARFDDAARDRFPHDAIARFTTTFVHRCGARDERLCRFTRYQVDGATRLVRWDLADGGASQRMRSWMSDEQKERCRREMNASDEAQCRRVCEATAGTACDLRCRARCGHDRFEPIAE